MSARARRHYRRAGLRVYCVGVLAFAACFFVRSTAGGALALALSLLGLLIVCVHDVLPVPNGPHLATWTRRRRPLQTSIRSLDELRHLPPAIQSLLADAQRIRRMFHARPFQPRGHPLWLIWEWQGRLRREADDLQRLLDGSDVRISRIDGALARLFEPGAYRRDGQPAWQSALLELDDALWRFIEAFAHQRRAYR